MEPTFTEKLRKLKALVLDVDGVLTDAGMYYGPEGETFKKFNTKDGMGIALLREKGFRFAFITGESSKIAVRRAEKLKIPVENVFLGVRDKAPRLQEFMDREGLKAEEVAYMGDDVNDLGAMKLAGVSFAPADAMDEVSAAADLVTTRRGGEGAVREVCERILSAQ